MRAGARRYHSASLDMTAPEVYAGVRLDPAVGAAIADAYMAAAVRDERAYGAYALFCRETVQQYHLLVGRVEFGGLGVAVRVVDEDPYADVESMIDDVLQRRLRVWASAATANPHPYLSDGENDMFRAVHDVFGHAASGRGFDQHGEEAAWLKHSTMYSPLARRALTTETRGQNCAQIFHYAGARFPQQKAVLLPPAFSDPKLVGTGVANVKGPMQCSAARSPAVDLTPWRTRGRSLESCRSTTR
ncbi:hypothetical protein [Micromonospora sp. NBC_01796]|uniref:hypothetical protein n=1 Tax=Micromonospora sp. NBC_01796 TaxID=2975987 RepID=UPI002DDC1793|nr:hypothetical protein [Micromonospora sp. NBC_01796]WSA83868.1 hypothetical protein OIE47_26330 [Micromonospora sp. NBC_01796]